MDKKFMSLLILSLVILIASCKKEASVSFPEDELGYSEPDTFPLVFTPEKKLYWDTIRHGGLKPVVKKLDIDALSSEPYDPSGFKPFAAPPKVVHFDYNNLPDTVIDFAGLPEKPLNFITSLLQPVVLNEIPLPTARKGNPLSLFDFGRTTLMKQNLIGSMFLDHNGLLWIGGNDGLFRYDGEYIQQFIKGYNSFPTISGITEDNNGNIWFAQIRTNQIGMINLENGTVSYMNNLGGNSGITNFTVDEKGNIWMYNSMDKAVSIIDPQTLTYKNLGFHAGLSDSTSFQVIPDIHNNLWISTFNKGINIVDPVSGKIRYLGTENGLSNDSLSSIGMDSQGRMYITNTNGFDIVDILNGTISYYSNLQGLTKNFTLQLGFDNEGRFWRNTQTGLEVIDVENKKIRNIGHSEGLMDDFTTGVLFDRYDRAWISTLSGLSIIDGNANTIHPFGTTQIISIEEDEVGNLWLATQNGVLIVDAARKKVRKLDQLHGLSNDFVQDFSRIDGKIEISTNGGFNIIDPVQKTITIARKSEGLPNDTIYGIIKDRSGDYWISGPSGGVARLDSEKELVLKLDAKGGLSNNSTMDIREDHEGLIWIAPQSGGINVIDPTSHTVKYLNNQPGLRDTCQRVMLVDDYGRVWLSSDKGIYIVDKKAGTLTNISTKQGLSSNTVLSLLPYKGNVIAGTNSMINIITPPTPDQPDRKWEVNILDKSEGIVKETNSWNTDAVTEKGEYMWGDNGLTIFDRIEPAHDSVPTYITGLKLMGDPMYFINYQSKGQKDTSLAKSQSRLVSLGYADVGQFKWDSVTGPYNMPVNLVLPYNDNYLQFQFSQANLGRQSLTNYVYILEGIDKKWSNPTTKTVSENYLNLPPGRYTFKVSSKGIDGKWKKPAELSFTISPPWYKTWLAYIIYIIIIFLSLRAYIVFRSRKLKKENKLLEEKVAHRTQQLSHSIEELKATQDQLVQSEKMASLGELTAGIAHEIQNPLNFVNNFSDVNRELITELREEIDKGNYKEVKAIANDLEENELKINHHGKRAEAIVKGMLQHSRGSSSHKELTDLNALCDEYLRLSYHGLRARDKSFNADFKLELDDSLEKANIVPQDIGRVMLNLINNAFFAVKQKAKLSNESSTEGERYKPLVTVSTKYFSKDGEKKYVEICVKDNGAGIPSDIKEKIFQPFFTTKPAGQGTGLGLSMSYEIITKGHGGKIRVESVQNEGTEFIIHLPIG